MLTTTKSSCILPLTTKGSKVGGGDEVKNNLKYLREQQQVTQIYVAEKIGVTQQAIAKWENGESMPRAEKLIQLAKLFDCTVDELLGERGEEDEKV